MSPLIASKLLYEQLKPAMKTIKDEDIMVISLDDKGPRKPAKKVVKPITNKDIIVISLDD
ncbi:hypothetical protein MJO28_004192 [Puccinia striiformis f. sp. tritici]|uniref:Uncharacterized protein n=1 Tax=Puccinia striiformis f. sp. tritici TaxID=168172 RepID=A0ACC0EQE0_9BASI|nr:hypothetical protein MJO28_004192 [Puccinia striiformis f. sp. tritici]